MAKRRRRRPGRQLRLEAVPPDVLALEVPVRKYAIEVAPGKRAFVFTVRHEDRLKLSQLRLEQMAQVLGNLVHPHSSTLIVVQPAAELEVYEVKLSVDTGAHAAGDAAAPQPRPATEAAG